MEPTDSTRIVKFSDGGKLTSEEAESGPYVFAGAEAEPGVTYAFRTEDAAEEEERWAAERGLTDALAKARAVTANLPDIPSAGAGQDERGTDAKEITRVGEITTRLIDLLLEQQRERRALERELSDAVTAARAVTAPEARSAEAEDAVRAEVAEIKRVAEITSRLMELSAEGGAPAIGTPAFLQRAHDEGVFDSAILYEQSYFRSPPILGVSTDVPDLRLLSTWPNGAHSVECIGFQVVNLYELPYYGPDRNYPKARRYGNCRDPYFPNGIRSICFGR